MPIGNAFISIIVSKISPIIYQDYIIDTSTSVFNLSTFLITNGWNGINPINARVTINSDVYIDGGTTGSGSFIVDKFPASSNIYIINNGTIRGAGGDGGDAKLPIGAQTVAFNSGVSAKPCFYLNYKTFLENYGSIIAGGNGGNSGESYQNYIRAAAGGGGGGAGYPAGKGGITVNSAEPTPNVNNVVRNSVLISQNSNGFDATNTESGSGGFGSVAQFEYHVTTPVNKWELKTVTGKAGVNGNNLGTGSIASNLGLLYVSKTSTGTISGNPKNFITF